MNKNWILLLFAIIGLASCSIEKRVYQPGYHIEWNLNAEKGRSEGVFQDVSQVRSEGASQDLPQDLSKNLETDVSQGRSEVASQDMFQDAAQGRSEGASQDLFQDGVQGRSEVASQDLPQVLSENLSKNLATDVSQVTGQSIDSDLELVLYVILSLFLPALTVFLMEGFSKNFWIALILMVLAFSIPTTLFLKLLIEGIATVVAIAVVLHYL